MSETKWELVNDEPLERVRRFRVPGGWLYQVEIDQLAESVAHDVQNVHTYGWHPPVFVTGGEP